MGCVSSKQAAAKPHLSSVPPRPADRKSPPSLSSRATTAAPSAGSATYDTKSSASLSTNGKELPVAFFGILGSAESRLTLADRASNSAPDKRIVTAVLPDDDAAPKMVAQPQPGAAGSGASSFGAVLMDGEEGLVAVRGVVMTLPYVVLVAGLENRDEGRVRELVEATFAQVNAHLNVWNPDSDIAALNLAPPQKAIPIAPLLANLFHKIDRLHAMSEMRFDPTASVLNLAWMQSITEHGRPPMAPDVAHLRHAVGWETKVKRKDGNSASRANANTVVDIDGAAKGFAVDLVFEAVCNFVRESGGQIGGGGQVSVFVDWAGDIRASGKHPAGRPWRTAVMRPPGLKTLFKHWAAGKLNTCLEGAEATHFVDLAHPCVVISSVTGGSGAGSDAGDESTMRQFSVESYRANSEILSAMASTMSNVGADTVRGGVALATSGDYFHIQKFGYHHIASPVDKEVMKAGAQSVASVSVLASSCVIADGLATAAMTCTNSEEAAQFLEGLIRRKPDEIFGYAIIGRNRAHETNVVTSSYFKLASSTLPATASDAALTKGLSGADTPLTNVPKLDEQGVDKILAGCPRVPGLLRWPGSPHVAQVDSLVSLSMDPEPVVSFTLPTPLIDNSLATIKSTTGVLSFVVGQGENAATAVPAALNLQVIKTIRVDDVASVAIAAVVGATQGNCSTIRITHAKRSVSYGLTRVLEETVFAQLALVEQVKAVLRRVPSGVWIVVTEAAHGGRHALTASSVASSAVAPSMLTFNVMDRNIFSAAFLGIGSTVSVYALEGNQEHLSAKFVEKSPVSDGDWEGLRAGSMLCMELEIEQVSRVKDHMLAVGRVFQASVPTSSSGKVKSPLVWLDRKYERLTS